MKVPQIVFKIIYNPKINYILRHLNKSTNTVLKLNIKLPPSGVINLKTNSGTIKMKTNQTSYLTQLLFWNGYNTFEYSSIFEVLSKSVNSFLDIGSNIGYYSLLAAKSNPNIKAYAFEPAVGPKYFLKQNIKINNFSSKIEAIDIALSNTRGTIDFYEVGNLKYKYLTHNLAGEGNAGTKKTSRNFIKTSVETNTLDNFINLQAIKEVDLIKMDTEGTEVDILKYGTETIKQFEPIIICETLFNTIETELEAFFKPLGYQFYNHVENGLVKVESITRTKDNGIRNCFFVPKSKLHLIEQFIV